jgi:hypothetical protein
MKGIKLFAIIVLLMVGAVIITTLLMVGSPLTVRERRFDDQRLSDLKGIASAIDQYVVNTGRLPFSLDQLTKPEAVRLYYLRSITDPVTLKPYLYTPSEGNAFKLCASFTHASDEKPDATPLTDKMWIHPAGSKCFDLVSTQKRVKTFCDVTKPCQQGQTCAKLPNISEALCVAQGWECLAAGCASETACLVAESYPAIVTCGK